MNNSDFVVSYPEFFVAEFREETLWLRFSGNFFHNFQSFDRTDFHNIYQEIGMLPKGGGPYVLSRLLGTAKAKQLLLRPRITAQEALVHGIADTVVPVAQLEARALEVARHYNEMSEQTLLGVKRLVNYELRGLKDYLTFESEQIIKIGQNKHFGQ